MYPTAALVEPGPGSESFDHAETPAAGASAAPLYQTRNRETGGTTARAPTPGPAYG
jgi:hypothetical protein